MKNKSLVLSNTYVTKVQNLDALGQGQCTIDDNRAYISKTLPEELIECTIDEKKKGVYFGSLIAVQKSSPLRITPECPHFNACSGCSYLHVNYDNELNFKKMSLTKNLGYLKAPNYELQVLASPQRFFYRNRIQLHYRLKPYPLIGYLNKNSIIPMINCLLPMQILKNFLDGFLPQWEKRLPANAPQEGHVEIYVAKSQVHIMWNAPYSHKGFTQVNELANLRLLDLLKPFFSDSSKPRTILELFCGGGNLLSFIGNNHAITGVDIQGSLSKPHTFHPLDLYSPSALKQVISLSHQEKFQDIVLDPPRSGFMHLSEIVKASSPERLFYVSCWSSTMIRDLNEVYKMRPWSHAQIFLIDMFPGTKHYETLFVIHW